MPDSPTTGSLVYSLGHRNPQGIAWDADGHPWAAEFGQNTWDEFNRIEPGGNSTTALPFLSGSLWLLTNNTDGRGSPGDGDDKLVEVRLDVSRAG